MKNKWLNILHPYPYIIWAEILKFKKLLKLECFLKLGKNSYFTIIIWLDVSVYQYAIFCKK